jgi:hypothetical protein
MLQQDRERFLACLLATSEEYRKPISEAGIALWWRQLARFDIEAVERAFDLHIANPETGRFMPHPADIIGLIEGGTQDGALQAWTKVDHAVRTVGPHASVVFDDPLIHRVLHEMGGWIALGTKALDEWPFVGKEFATRYRAYRVRRETPEYPRALIGLNEAHNTARGLPCAPPVFVGDPVKAQDTLARGTQKPLIGVRQAITLTALPGGKGAA